MVYLDVYTRKIVGLLMDKTMSEQLAINALQAAIWSEKPPTGLIIHTDRGSQFIGKNYKDILQKHDFTASMSRPENPYDNAVAESIHKTLKTELMRGNGIFDNREVAKKLCLNISRFFTTGRENKLPWGTYPQGSLSNKSSRLTSLSVY